MPRYECLEQKHPPAGDANGNILHISSAATLRIKFGSALFKTNIFINAYFSMNIHIGTQFMNCYFKHNCGMDWHVHFNKATIPHLECTQSEPKVQELKAMDDDYSGATKGTQI